MLQSTRQCSNDRLNFIHMYCTAVIAHPIRSWTSAYERIQLNRFVSRMRSGVEHSILLLVLAFGLGCVVVEEFPQVGKGWPLFGASVPTLHHHLVQSHRTVDGTLHGGRTRHPIARLHLLQCCRIVHSYNHMYSCIRWMST